MQKDSLGNSIKIVRTLKGLGQAEVAAVCQFSVPLLSMFETGAREATQEQLQKIAAAISVRLDDLPIICLEIEEVLETHEVGRHTRPLLGMRLKKARENERLTQRELGLMIGRSQGYVSQLENGRVSITLAEVDQIRHVLKFS